MAHSGAGCCPQGWEGVFITIDPERCAVLAMTSDSTGMLQHNGVGLHAEICDVGQLQP